MNDPSAICADCGTVYALHNDAPANPRRVSRLDCGGTKAGFASMKASGQIPTPTIPAPATEYDPLEDTRPETPKSKTPAPFSAVTDFPNWRRLFDAFCALDSHRQHVLSGIAEDLKELSNADATRVWQLSDRLKR